MSNSVDISEYEQLLKNCLFLFINYTLFATMATRVTTHSDIPAQPISPKHFPAHSGPRPGPQTKAEPVLKEDSLHSVSAAMKNDPPPARSPASPQTSAPQRPEGSSSLNFTFSSCLQPSHAHQATSTCPLPEALPGHPALPTELTA